MEISSKVGSQKAPELPLDLTLVTGDCFVLLLGVLHATRVNPCRGVIVTGDCFVLLLGVLHATRVNPCKGVIVTGDCFVLLLGVNFPSCYNGSSY